MQRHIPYRSLTHVVRTTVGCLCLAAMVTHAASATALESPRTFVVVTVDHCLTRPGIIDLSIDGVACGLSRICDICTEHNVTPTFFVSPYDCADVGVDQVKAVVTYLQRSGADIQLHTDIAHGLSHHSLSEQRQIIAHGIGLLREWTGLAPIGHRAGDYAANDTTLSALADNGIVVDSSYFYGHPSCKLDATVFPKNGLYRAGSILEVSVSVFKLQITSALFGWDLPPLQQIRKIDIDWADFGQLTEAIDKLCAERVPVITLFLHFHSFFTPSSGVALSEVRVDYEDIGKFHAILDWLNSRSGVEVVSLSELLKRNPPDNMAMGRDIKLPIISRRVSFGVYARRCVGEILRSHFWGFSSGVVGLFAAVVWFLHRVYRKRRARHMAGI